MQKCADVDQCSIVKDLFQSEGTESKQIERYGVHARLIVLSGLRPCF